PAPPAPRPGSPGTTTVTLGRPVEWSYRRHRQPLPFPRRTIPRRPPASARRRQRCARRSRTVSLARQSRQGSLYSRVPARAESGTQSDIHHVCSPPREPRSPTARYSTTDRPPVPTITNLPSHVSVLKSLDITGNRPISVLVGAGSARVGTVEYVALRRGTDIAIENRLYDS